MTAQNPNRLAPINQGAADGVNDMSSNGTANVRHWRQLTDSKTLGVGDFPDDVTQWTLRIAKITAGKVAYADGPTKKPLIHFEGVTKPLAAGATVMTEIARMYGSDKPSDMVGKLVTLVMAKTDSYGKKGVDCVRILNKRPNASDLWGAPYDHAATLAQLEAAEDQSEIDDIRASVTARRPAKEFHAEIKSAVEAAVLRVKSAASKPAQSVDQAHDGEDFAP